MLNRTSLMALSVATTVVTAAVLAVPVFAASASMPAPMPVQVGTVDLASDTIRVNGVGHRRTIACEGRAVEVAGTEHQLTFTGVCSSLVLNGTDNTIEIGLAPNAPLAVSGTGQTVRWRSTGRPRQTVNGVDNTISQIRN